MKRYIREIILSIILTIPSVFPVRGQQDCSAAIGDVIESLTSSVSTNTTSEKFQIFEKFDFRRFVGVGTVSGVSKAKQFKVGTDETGVIREITYSEDGLKPLYRFLVGYFAGYKLMIVQDFVLNDGFRYNSSAIVILDKQPKYFMFLINMSPQFGDPIGSTGLVHSPKFMDFSIESMSAIMTLTENLRPWELFKFARTQIVQYSHFYYRKEAPNLIKMESANFYFNTDNYPAFRVTKNTCLTELATLLPTHVDFSVDLNPKSDDGDILWHWAGAHRYKVENERSVLRLPE